MGEATRWAEENHLEQEELEIQRKIKTGEEVVERNEPNGIEGEKFRIEKEDGELKRKRVRE